MARIYGLAGKMSGKMGTAVFRVREGQQILTQYNPIVKNPNTQAQQGTRARFKLMSQLAAIMQVGYGTMSVSERPARGKKTQRNSFFELNYRLVEVSTEGEVVIAKIPMEKLQLTSSFRQLGQLSLINSSAGEDSEISASITNISDDVASVRLVLVGYKAENDISQAYVEKMFDIPVTDGNVSYSISTNNFGKYTVLAFGLIPSASMSKKIDLDNIHTPSDENFISAVRLNEMVANGDMAETMTIGANIEVLAA